MFAQSAGFKSAAQHRYWDPAAPEILDLDGMIEDLEDAEEDSVLLLQACGHNPTGADPTEEEWRRVARVAKDRRMMPFIDMAYQVRRKEQYF